jgi:hypothetical protein
MRAQFHKVHEAAGNLRKKLREQRSGDIVGLLFASEKLEDPLFQSVQTMRPAPGPPDGALDVAAH